MNVICILFFFFFKQKTAYEIYQCDWSSDVCSSDLPDSASKFNIDLVKQKWQSFVDEISQEKGLTLAPVLSSLNLNSLSGNNLIVGSSLADSKKTIELNKKYLETMSEKFFGKRIHFSFSTIVESPDEKKNSSGRITSISEKPADAADEFEEFILKELEIGRAHV